MKTIFIDFDGTLLGYLTKNNVSDANKKAIFAAKKAGYLVVPSTGRSLEFVHKVNGQLDNIFDYAISSAGSLVYDYKTKTNLHYSPLDKNAVDSLCAIAQTHKIAVLAKCLDGGYSNSESAHSYENVTQPMRDFLKTKTVLMLTLADDNFDHLKAILPELENQPNTEITNRHKALDDPSYPRSGYAYVNVSPPNINKGTGVRVLCKKLGISPKDCIAIGDDFNDIPMFRECGYCVAVENALPSVKKLANHITDSNENDGVAKFLFALLDGHI